MTVSSATNRVSYNGNSSTTVFAYTFKIFDEDDLTVIIRAANGTETVKTITTHYTVSGVGNAGGGNVTMLTAPVTGETLVILREQDLVQELDIVPNDPFPADSVEAALDKLTFMVQQQQETLGRTIKASRTNTITGAEFTISAADRANKVFAFDGSGNVSITQGIGIYRGNWAASTAYAVRDIVKDTSNNNIYIANTAHTSSGSQPISTNADVAKWDLLVDAESATNSASAASASASAAASSASAASSSASAASSSASAASSSASAASSSASAASTSASNAAASYDSFDDRYLGAKSSDPSVDNDGDPLLDGALYFNSTANEMRVYDLGNTTWLSAAYNSSNVDINGGTIDGVTLGTNSAVTEAQVDNININGNAIISTNTNGNIALTPNGTGEVDISKVDIDSGTIDGVTIGGASAGAGTFTSVATTSLTVNGNNYPSAGPLSNRNKIINGAMQVAQRGTNFAGGTTNADDAYTLDRWYVLSEGSDSVDVDQVADSPDTGGKCIRLDVETTGEKFGIAQIVEAVNCTGLIGNTVTLSFAAKVSNARIDTVKAAVVAWSGTADTVTSDIVSSWGADGTTPTLIANATFENTPADLGVTTSWATYTVTANVDTASTANLIVFIWSDDATNPLAGDFLYITNVQLEAGGTATPFEHRSYGQELALCQRYFYVITGGVVGNELWGLFLSGFTTTRGFSLLFLPVPIRALPTITQSNSFPTNLALSSVGSVSGISAFKAEGSIVSLDVNCTGLVSGSPFLLALRSTTLSAEL